MKLLTPQKMANDAYSRWMQQYPGDASGKGEKLKCLGESPKPEDVDMVIGNTSWTNTPRCSECSATRVPVVQVGQEPEYDTDTAWLCKECLSRAVELYT